MEQLRLELSPTPVEKRLYYISKWNVHPYCLNFVVYPTKLRFVHPPRGFLRFLITYTVTFRIALSYFSLRVQSRFRSQSSIDELARRKHVVNARRIHQAIARLQGLFIKVGQLISIMTNFLPEEFRIGLEGLQDQVPPRPYHEIEKRVREELGKGPRELFAEFDEKPVAAASIGQVHRAKLHSGEDVAVKVQYPDLEEIVRIDLRTLSRIFRVIEYFIPHEGMDGVYREIRDMIIAELDFRLEASNVDKIASRFATRTDVSFPKVRTELSTSRVIVTEWIDGAKVSDRARLQQLGVDRSALARAVLGAYCQQIFTDGMYHADPHPGNLLVRATPEGGFSLVFIDFGAVAEISPRMRRGIADFIKAAITRDTPKLVQAMKDMGFIAQNADPALFDEIVDFMHSRVQEDIQIESFSLSDVKFDASRSLRNLADLRKMGSLRELAGQFHVPKEWIMFERTVLLLLGICTDLDPTLSPVEVIQPYIEEFVLGKNQDWSVLVVDTTKEVASTVMQLPAEMRKFMQRASRGQLEMRLRGIDEHARVVYAAGRQLIYAGFTIASAAFALVFEGRVETQRAQIAWIACAGFGLTLLFSFLTTRVRFRRK